MPTKNFKFDFNEDAEPVAELHRYRAALSTHFKTVDALMEHVHTSVAESGIVIKDGKVAGWNKPMTPRKKRQSKPLPKTAKKSKPR